MLVLLNSWVLSARGSVIVWHCPRSCWGCIYTSRSPAFLKEEQWDVWCACWPARLLRWDLWEGFGCCPLLSLISTAALRVLSDSGWMAQSGHICPETFAFPQFSHAEWMHLRLVKQTRSLSLWTAFLLPPLGAEMLKIAQRHSVYWVIPQHNYFVLWHLTWNRLNGLFVTLT